MIISDQYRFAAAPLIPVERQILQALTRGSILIARDENRDGHTDLLLMLLAMLVDGLVEADQCETFFRFSITDLGRVGLAAPSCQ